MSTVAGSHATAAGPLVYDPYAYGIHEDPYPIYARLRDEAPLYRNDERGFWALSRHTDVLAAFRDSDRFSNAEGGCRPTPKLAIPASRSRSRSKRSGSAKALGSRLADPARSSTRSPADTTRPWRATSTFVTRASIWLDVS